MTSGSQFSSLSSSCGSVVNISKVKASTSSSSDQQD